MFSHFDQNYASGCSIKAESSAVEPAGAEDDAKKTTELCAGLRLVEVQSATIKLLHRACKHHQSRPCKPECTKVSTKLSQKQLLGFVRTELIKDDAKHMLAISALADEREPQPDGSTRTTYVFLIILDDAAAAERLLNLQGTTLALNKDKLLLESVDVSSHADAAKPTVESMLSECTAHFFAAAEPPHDDRFAVADCGARPDTLVVRGVPTEWLNGLNPDVAKALGALLDDVVRAEIAEGAGGEAELYMQFGSLSAMSAAALLFGTHWLAKDAEVRECSVSFDKDAYLSDTRTKQRRAREYELEQMRKRKRPDVPPAESKVLSPRSRLPNISKLGSLKHVVPVPPR